MVGSEPTTIRETSGLSSALRVLFLPPMPQFSHLGSGDGNADPHLQVAARPIRKSAKTWALLLFGAQQWVNASSNLKYLESQGSISPSSQWQNSCWFWWYRLTRLSSKATRMLTIPVRRLRAKRDFFNYISLGRKKTR